MKKLLVYMKGNRKECILGPVFKMLEAVFELFIPLVVAKIIDVGIANHDSSYVIKMTLVMALLGVVGLCSTLVAQYFAAKASVSFVGRIRYNLFKHISSLSYTELDELGTSTLITRMTSDTNQIQSGVNLVLRLFTRSPFIVIGAMVMAFTVDTRSALTFVLAIPVLSIIIFGIMSITIPLYKKAQARLDRVVNTSRENLTGIRVIRAFGLESAEKEKFHRQTNELAAMQRFVGKISAITNPLTYAVINIAIALLIYSGAVQVKAGELSAGEVVALYNYMSQILIELIKFATLIVTTTKALASAKRVEAVFEIKSSQKTEGTLLYNGNEAGVPAVEFKDVSLKYNSSPECSLENISFKVYPGETVGIIGGTGSGKSSLVNMITRFYDAHSGQVLINGKPVESYDIASLREKIGVVPQATVLFKGTVRDNLKWGDMEADDEAIMSAIDVAQARDIIETKGKGLDLVIEEGGKNLSGGQRQRLTIARALVGKPSILILDDSFSALDYRTDKLLRQALKGLDFKPTVFTVSQRTASLQDADKIIVLDDGKIVGMGTHKELLDTCEIYAEIHASQGAGRRSNEE